MVQVSLGIEKTISGDYASCTLRIRDGTKGLGLFRQNRLTSRDSGFEKLSLEYKNDENELPENAYAYVWCRLPSKARVTSLHVRSFSNEITDA